MALQHPAQTLASHLISQTLGSIAAMENLSIISADDAAAIRARLPNPYATFPHLASGNTGSVTPVPGGLANPLVPAQAQNNNNLNSFAAPPAAPPYGTPGHGPSPPRARALWDYNGTDAGDLQFRTGEIILIDDEVNAEWFRGRVEGRSPEKGGAGLFPSNFVEKLSSGPGGPGGFAPPPPPQQQQYYQPQPVMAPPPPAQSGPMQPVPAQQEGHKHGKLGKVGGQLGNAAVNGAGFGFGASLAGNLVNKIF